MLYASPPHVAAPLHRRIRNALARRTDRGRPDTRPPPGRQEGRGPAASPSQGRRRWTGSPDASRPGRGQARPAGRRRRVHRGQRGRPWPPARDAGGAADRPIAWLMVIVAVNPEQTAAPFTPARRHAQPARRPADPGARPQSAPRNAVPPPRKGWVSFGAACVGDAEPPHDRQDGSDTPEAAAARRLELPAPRRWCDAGRGRGNDRAAQDAAGRELQRAARLPAQQAHPAGRGAGLHRPLPAASTAVRQPGTDAALAPP